MKKSIKILSLVLAIALVCGALVIGAFAAVDSRSAEVPGITVVHASDLEDSAMQVVKGADAAAAGGINKFGTIVASITGRHGILQTVASQYETNQYITFTPGSVVSAGGGPYFGSGYAKAESSYAVATQANALDHQYQILDMDVAFPAGRAINYILPKFEIRYLNASGANATLPKNSSVGFLITSDDTANAPIQVIDNNGGYSDVRGTLSGNGEWSHVTFIVELVDSYALEKDGTACSETTEGAIAVYDIYTYVIVNDTIITKRHLGNTISYFGLNTSNTNSKDARDFVFVESRFNFQEQSNTTYNKDAVIAFDNITWRSIDTSVYEKTEQLAAALNTGNGGSIATWEDSLYDADNMPFGNLAATITADEVTTNYDSLEKAIAAATSGQTVTLQANSKEVVEVNKAITVAKNGYTANLVNVNTKITETDTEYKFEASSVFMRVRVSACACGNNCIEGKTVNVYEGGNVWDAIVNAYGKEPTCSYSEGDIKYEFAGFTVTGTAASYFTNGEFNKDFVVPADAGNKVAILAAKYNVIAPIAKKYDKDGNYVKSYFAGTSVATALGECSNGTLQLLADVYEDGQSTKYFSTHSYTIDLNGYTIKHLPTPEASSKGGKPLFQNQTATLTITSTKVGAKIFSGACYKVNNRAAQPFVTAAANNGVTNFIGRNADGETTLSFYGANAFQSYGSYTSVNVDGGYYVRNRGDNYALFDMRVSADCSFKNATMEGPAGNILSFCGRTAGMGGKTSNVTVDNCIFTGGVVLGHAADCTIITFTNCVIDGTMPAATDGTSAVAMTGDEITIGKGCKITANASFNSLIQFASDPVATSETIEYTALKNDWTVGADNFALTESTVTINVTSIVAEPIEVEFVQGETSYGTQTVIAGMNATIPMGEVPGTEGLVNRAAIVAVPADAKTGDKITVPENPEYSYSAGKVPVQFSLSMTTHFSANYFLPEVEGVKYITLNSGLPGRTNRAFYKEDGVTFAAGVKPDLKDGDGKAWIAIQDWPGAYSLDESGKITIIYTYEGTTLSYTTKEFSPVDYARYMIENEPAEIATVAADLAKYVYEFNMAKKGAASAAIIELLDAESTKAAMSNNTIPETASNAAAKAKMAEDGYITEIAVIAKAEGATVGIKLNGNYGFKMYKDDPDNEGNQPNWEQNQWRIDGTGYMYMHNLRSYALNDTFVIEVYESYTGTSAVTSFVGEPIATYEWSLAGYINDNELTNSALAVALYNYACSADAYLAWANENGYKTYT